MIDSKNTLGLSTVLKKKRDRQLNRFITLCLVKHISAIGTSCLQCWSDLLFSIIWETFTAQSHLLCWLIDDKFREHICSEEILYLLFLNFSESAPWINSQKGLNKTVPNKSNGHEDNSHTHTHTAARSKFKSDRHSDESYFKYGCRPIFHKIESK